MSEIYKLLFERNPRGIVIHKKMQVLDANEAFLNMLGLHNKEKIIGTSLLKFIPDNKKAVDTGVFCNTHESYQPVELFAGKATIKKAFVYTMRFSDDEDSPLISFIHHITESKPNRDHTVTGGMQHPAIHEKGTDAAHIDGATYLFYQHVLSIMKQAVIAVDTSGRIVYINQYAEHLFEYSHIDIVGKEDVLLHLEDEKTRRVYTTVAEFLKDAPGTSEVRYKNNMNKEVFLQVTTSLIFDNDHTVLGTAAIFTDVTNHKRADYLLMESKLQKTAILETAANSIVTINREGKIIEANTAAANLFGIQKRNLIGKEFAGTVFSPSSAKAFRSAYGKYLKYRHISPYIGKPFKTYIIGKDHESIPIELTIKPPHVQKIQFMTAYIRDITKEERREKLQRFLSEASVILTSALDEKLILKKIAYLSVPTIAHACTVDLIHNGKQLQNIALCYPDVSGKKPVTMFKNQLFSTPLFQVNVNNQFLHKNALVFNDISHSPLFSDKKLRSVALHLNLHSVIVLPMKAHHKMIGVITLLSEKAYTKEDISVAEELAYRCALATDNAQLYTRAQREIDYQKELETRKDDFISMASHELKTPLTTSRIYAQLLKSDLEKNNHVSLKMAVKVNEQLDKLTDLVLDLLDVTKIEAGKLDFKEKVFDICELVAETVENIHYISQRHTFIVEGDKTCKVKGDEDRIGQVIINLLTNAIKFSPEADTIIVKVVPGIHSVTVSVQDFGVGIPAKELPKVFDRFYQVGGGRKAHTFPGLGLGLFISYEIIKRHNGELWVESTENKGSIFSFTLPRIQRTGKLIQ